MRFFFKLATLIALTATTMLVGPRSEATAFPAADGLRAAIASVPLAEQIQFRWNGREHCWYDRGWHGPGWYWCGYENRRGLGWGGPRGWRNWRHPSWR